MPEPARTPEVEALERFKSRCLDACHVFYNDSPEKSIENACTVLKEDVFKGEGIVECEPGLGMEDFPTFEMYIREALLEGEGLEIDPQIQGRYMAILGPDRDLLLKRLDDGEIKLTKLARPVTYESYRKEEPGKVAIFKFIRDTSGKTDIDGIFQDILDNCDLEFATSNNIRKGQISRFLIDKGFAKRDIDAKKMADDILDVFPKCKVRE